MKEKIDLLRNVALVAMASYIESAVGLLAGVLIARTLGPEEYGHYAFGIWICGALIMAGNNALPISSIKFLAEVRGSGREDVAAALLRRFLRLQFISSTLVLGAFVAIAVWRPFADWAHQLPLMLGIATVAVWSRAGFWMRGAIGKGYERFLPENLSLAVTAAANLVIVVVLAWKGATVAEFFAAYAGLGVLSNVLVRYMIRHLGTGQTSVAIPEDVDSRLRRHLVLTGVMMLLLVGTNKAVEMTLLKAYASAEAVGYFAIAGALTKGAVEILAGGMSAVLLPAMSRRFGEAGERSLGRMLSESARLYWFVGMAIVGLGLTVSQGIVHLLYGQRYEGAIPALMWHLVISGLIVVNSAASAVLTASDRQMDRIRIICVALGVNVVAGLSLIPRFGLNGAIASFAITSLCSTALSWIYALRRTSVRLPIAAMLRLSAASLIATLLGYLVAEEIHFRFAFIGGALAFLGSYIPLTVIFRTWREGDFDVVAKLVERSSGIGGVLSRRILRLRRYALPDLD